MISRVADHCFWLGRHVERAGSTARVLEVTRNLSLDAGLTPEQCWWPAVVVSGEEAAFRARYRAWLDDGELVQRYLTWDEQSLTSIRSTVRAARENARAVRDALSQDVWEVLNELHLWLAGGDAQEAWRDDRHGFYRRVLRGCQQAHGLVHDTMLHDDPLQFFSLGAMLERAGQTARLLDVHHHALGSRPAPRVIETDVSLALLHACSGFEPFMRRNRGPVSPGAIAAFLVLDPAFPRSVRFAIASAHRVLRQLHQDGGPTEAGAEALERLGALDAWMVLRPPAAVDSAALHDTLTEIVDRTAEVCEAIGRELLGHAPAAAAPEALQ